jgi:hypothetical protein
MDKGNVVYIHKGILFDHKDQIYVAFRKWMELEMIILSEISQA